MVRVRVRVGFYHEPKSAGAIDTATLERSRTFLVGYKEETSGDREGRAGGAE